MCRNYSQAPEKVVISEPKLETTLKCIILGAVFLYCSAVGICVSYVLRGAHMWHLCCR